MKASELYRLAQTLKVLALKATQEREEGAPPVAQLAIIEDVARNPRSTIGAIAARTGLAQSFVSRTVDLLMQPGLLTRDSDPSDRRRSCVSVSKEGMVVIKKRAGRNVDAALAAAYPHLDASAQKSLLAQLAAVAAVLRPAG